MSDNAEQRAVTRQALTATTFVEIVDTLVDNFDVIDVLTVLTSRSVELLEAAAAGILLADETRQLRVIGASSPYEAQEILTSLPLEALANGK